MAVSIEERNRLVLHLLNGTSTSLKTIVPMQHELSKPQLLGNLIHFQFGVLIGFTGDVKGRLIISGDHSVFQAVGESMFGMFLEGEMLSSFSGELGNMIAGNLSTNIIQNGLETDITAPTVMEGDTTISGYSRAIYMAAQFEQAGKLGIHLLID